MAIVARAISLKNYQARVVYWCKRAFGLEQVDDPRIRGLRLLEEAVEFAQSVGIKRHQAHKLLYYVYSRPAGVPAQELGGVGVTWLAAAESLGIQAEGALLLEINRVESKPIEHFKARNQQKCDLGFK